jgi:2-methylfumaryl-CoA hydratase
MNPTELIDISGPWFEDLYPGLEFDAPAITLNAGHGALHQALFGDRLRLPLDAATAARVTGAEQPLCHPLLAINIAIGQSTWASQRVKGNLFYRGLALQQPVFKGDTLHTRTRVVGLRQNRPQAGRAATGIVALEMTTTNQRGATVLHFWRCPMLPCRDPEARTGHADALDAIGRAVDATLIRQAVPRGWTLEPTAAWSGRRAADLVVGQRFRIEARDTITAAPELVRLSLNMAMAHTDSKLSHLGERLVYGGHTIFMGFAQITRALPNLLSMLAWESCDHLAPVIEGDRLRSEFTVTDIVPLSTAEGGGALLRLAADCYAARGQGEQETRVLDWKFWAWSL